jgi:hypothetical protein
LGSWILFLTSLIFSGGRVLTLFPGFSTSLSNWIFWGGAVAAIASTVLLCRYLIRERLLSVPLVAGIAGASLSSVGIVLAAVK